MFFGGPKDSGPVIWTDTIVAPSVQPPTQDPDSPLVRTAAHAEHAFDIYPFPQFLEWPDRSLVSVACPDGMERAQGLSTSRQGLCRAHNATGGRPWWLHS